MAVGIAAAQANSWLDTLGGTLYAKLHLGDPGPAGTANPAAETDRIAISFGAAAGGVIANNAVVTWLAVAATETVSHVSYWDAVTAGNFKGSDALATPRDLLLGDDAEFAIGALTLSITPVAA